VVRLQPFCLPPFFFFYETSPRYDCELDQWNHCYEFDFAEDVDPHDDESNSEEKVFGNVFETPTPPHPHPKGKEFVGQVPASDSGFYLKELRHRTASDLVGIWKDFCLFLRERYGLSDFTPGDRDLSKFWSTVLGVKLDIPNASMIDLYESVVYNNAWPSHISLPTRSVTSYLDVTVITEGYLLSVNDGRTHGWKLLVEDPLTILQIRREFWDMDPDSLILNLVKRGLPFQVLHTHVLHAASFYQHPGPAIHPPGRSPTHKDYLAYRHELVGFFVRYPHAYAAALCAGGILWRIAVDIFPLPTEQDIVSAFHPDACLFRTVGGQIYGTPRLTSFEEQVIVGVYKWAESKRTQT